MILEEDTIIETLEKMKEPNSSFNQIYPGYPVSRKPVHTVYGGAQLFIAERTDKIGKSAQQYMDAYVDNFVEFAKLLQLKGYDQLPNDPEAIMQLEKELGGNNDRSHYAWLSYTVYNRVIEKLENEPVEDFRIDFEDGFGKRSDEDEDYYAELTANEVAKGMKENSLPPFIGIRIKPLTENLKHRSIRTLNIFMSTLLEATGDKLPDNFVITLPKVTMPEEVETLCVILENIENRTGLEKNCLKVEIMIETPQSIINHDGSSNLPLLVKPGKQRITGVHFGVYDYTASVNIIAKHQEMDHIACDFARHMMKVAFAGTGIRLSDGATNTLPVGPNRANEGENLSEDEIAENKRVVYGAWKKGFDHIIHSLENAFYQGWDLHPAQLPIRYAAVYSFFLENLDNSINRLKSFVNRAAQATLTGDVFDDAATALALLNYFNLALETKSITPEEAKETGLTISEIERRSFDKIIENRS